MCTHLGNGIASTINRHNNPLWPQLAEDRLLASVIADLEHLPPPILKTIARVKGPDRLMITSDAVHIAGLKPGHYDLAGMPVELLKTGRIRLSGTDLLAGSATTLLQGVLNVARYTDLTLTQAFACASRVPGALFDVKNLVPRESAARANLVVFDRVIRGTRETPRIHAVFVDGLRVL
jgi:N-acetylglucosamine-6-phosphate deacetylase